MVGQRVFTNSFDPNIIIKMINAKGQGCKKEGHMGIGLENVRNALKKYEGTMEIKEEKETYRIVITIPQV